MPAKPDKFPLQAASMKSKTLMASELNEKIKFLIWTLLLEVFRR